MIARRSVEIEELSLTMSDPASSNDSAIPIQLTEVDIPGVVAPLSRYSNSDIVTSYPLLLPRIKQNQKGNKRALSRLLMFHVI